MLFFNRKPKLKVEVLPNGEGLPLINYAKPGDAGMDLRAAFSEYQIMGIAPGEWQLIPCGFKMELPKGYEGQVRARSGLSLKQGLFVLNSPGTVDEGYRGEVGVILANFSKTTQYINRGDRIAQLVITKVGNVLVTQEKSLSLTVRGATGYGSSGRN